VSAAEGEPLDRRLSPTREKAERKTKDASHLLREKDSASITDMRTVQVHLRNTTEAEVADFLQRTYPFQKGPTWICDVSGDACLYIDFNPYVSVESEPGEWDALIEASGGSAPITVAADISGRHAGHEQVAAFVQTMLSRFEGFATDDYSGHLWTIDEINARMSVEGFLFFGAQA